MCLPYRTEEALKKTKKKKDKYKEDKLFCLKGE